jgi:hypothetical protein
MKLVVGAATGAGSPLELLPVRIGVGDDVGPPATIGANPLDPPGASTGFPVAVCVGAGAGVRDGSRGKAATLTGASVGVAVRGMVVAVGEATVTNATSFTTRRGLMSCTVSAT